MKTQHTKTWRIQNRSAKDIYSNKNLYSQRRKLSNQQSNYTARNDKNKNKVSPKYHKKEIIKISAEINIK